MPRRWSAGSRQRHLRDTALGPIAAYDASTNLLSAHRHRARILMQAVCSAPDLEYCAFEAWPMHSPAHGLAQYSPPSPVMIKSWRAYPLRRHGTLRALFKTPVKKGDFHGTLRAHAWPIIGILRALRRDFTCALLIYSCSSGREPVVG